VSDFGLVYNAYVRFEENCISMLGNNEEDDNDDDISDVTLARKLDKLLKITVGCEQLKIEDEIDLKLYKLEQLLKRRSLLLNSCLLR
jgi:pre-mRNA-splicing factor SYF1